MAGTIQQIADLAGVSRGTVDRALNHRGRIKPEVAERIWQIAEEIGYEPRRISGTMSAQKKQTIKIGVITHLSKSSFMVEVNRGINAAKRELTERGVEILTRDNASVDEGWQLNAIDELMEEEIDGLAIMPVECESVRAKLNKAIEERNIPVVTFNSDIVGTKRNCFVGLDNKKSGYTAAGLLGMIMHGKGKVLVITGFFTNSVNSLRVDGFIEEMRRSFPGVELMGVQSSYDDAQEVENIIVNMLSMVPDLGGIFVASGGQAGVHQAFEKLKLKRRPYVIVYDMTEKNKRGLLANDFDFLIDQGGYEQGYRPPHLLFNMITKKRKVPDEFSYTDIEIKTKYNI